MAIEYDLKEINAKLDTLNSAAEKLKYLNDYLFAYKKKRAEFIATDSITLEHLKVKTENDYKIYRNVFDNGGLIYFNDDETDARFLKSYGFENIPLIKKRLHLEYSIKSIEGTIALFEGLIEKVKSEFGNTSENLIEKSVSNIPISNDIKDIFYPGKENDFLLKEKKLIDKVCINSDSAWTGTKLGLCMFIYLLWDADILMKKIIIEDENKIIKKTELASRKMIRKAFENRYKISIKNEFKPVRENEIRNKCKNDFTFLI